MDKPAILIFGLGFLQKSLIKQCKELGLFTVGVDIFPDAECRDEVDAFEVAAGDDYDTTLEIAKKYHVSGVVTAATDKPLVMMARVAEALKLPFYSVQTSLWSTDKLQMKKRFQEFGVPCAKGVEVDSIEGLHNLNWDYPIIVKPRDNSGSRGVIFCETEDDASKALNEAFDYTHKNTILVEEVIGGQEYSVESLHYNGKTHVIQFTQKITTEFPYNVELGHIQPADISDERKKEIRSIITRIAEAMGFDNCASHTELKINDKGITVIETSPRLGGDFITSTLTPLSTGVNLEKLLVRMSIGEKISDVEFLPIHSKSSGVVFFELPEGIITEIRDIDKLSDVEGCQAFEFNKKIGDTIGRITNSIDRYGYALVSTDGREETLLVMQQIRETIIKVVRIK